MDRDRMRDLVRKGVNLSSATQAFEDNLDLDGTSRGGGRQRKKRQQGTSHPQPQQYSYDQPQNFNNQGGQYQGQNQGGYGQPGGYGQGHYYNQQPTQGPQQYPGYASSPQQSSPPSPTSCTCTFCDYCKSYFADCYDASSRLYFCRYHHRQVMRWINPGIGHHNCPGNNGSPPPNQPHYSYGSGPSYPQGQGQPPGQAYGAAPRSLDQESSSPPPGPQAYQQLDYGYGGVWTQEPGQLRDQAGRGEARDYYYPGS